MVGRASEGREGVVVDTAKERVFGPLLAAQHGGRATEHWKFYHTFKMYGSRNKVSLPGPQHRPQRSTMEEASNDDHAGTSGFGDPLLQEREHYSKSTDFEVGRRREGHAREAERVREAGRARAVGQHLHVHPRAHPGIPLNHPIHRRRLKKRSSRLTRRFLTRCRHRLTRCRLTRSRSRRRHHRR